MSAGKFYNRFAKMKTKVIVLTIVVLLAGILFSYVAVAQSCDLVGHDTCTGDSCGSPSGPSTCDASTVGQSQTVNCGGQCCGTQSRTCEEVWVGDEVGYAWGPWSACEGGDDTCGGDCGNCGNWACGGVCANQGVCSPGSTETQDCGGGNCGTQSRTCTSSCSWGSWSSCTLKSGSECFDGDTTTSGCLTDFDNCGGTQTCSNCQWGACTGGTDCSAVETTETDAGPTDYLNGGSVTDTDGCSSGSCTSTTYTDSCSGTVLTEYGADGTSFTSTEYDCQNYESDYCQDNRLYNNEWGCSGSPGYCNDASVPDVLDGTDADNDGVDQECEDTTCDFAPGVCDTAVAGKCIAKSGEVCGDGLDNDCDGSIDEDCLCIDGDFKFCGTDEGVCEYGTQTCSGGTWGSCTGGVSPGAETCGDALDNDCDGNVDEGCGCTEGDTKSCGTDVGICAFGTQTCVDGGWSTCTGGIRAEKEICNDALDNDCDALTDCGEATECFLHLTGIVTDADTGVTLDETFVEVKDQNLNTITTGTSNSEGEYISTDLICGTFNLIASREDYVPATNQSVDIPPNTRADFKLVWGQVCEDDCTYASDNIVRADCDNINGCNFCDDTAKSACDLSEPDWIRDYNATHEVVCGEGCPRLKVQVETTVVCEGENLIKTTKVVNYKGQLVRMVVVTCG